MKVGDRVRRNTNEPGYQGTGYVLLVDTVLQRAKVQWETNKTWYKISNLILIETSNVC
jgi:hypothetical protein